MSIKTEPNRKYVARDENINNKKNAFYIYLQIYLFNPPKLKITNSLRATRTPYSPSTINFQTQT